MPKFDIDYNKLSAKVATAEQKQYKLSDVKHKLEKVAFDLFKFKDGNPDELWQIQSADDGDFIVARYDSAEVKTEKTASAILPWQIFISQASGDINVFYKSYPITKVASSQIGLSKEDLKTVETFLPKKLSTDIAFVKALLSSLTKEAKEEVLKLYPELGK